MRRVIFNSNYDIEQIIINENDKVSRSIFIQIFSLQINLFIVKIEINDEENENAIDAACQIFIDEQQKN